MAAKGILVLCVTSLFAEVLCQCIGREAIFGSYESGWPYDGLASCNRLAPFGEFGLGTAWPAMGYGAGIVSFAPEITAGFGGGLYVISSSPIAPTGIIVTSENEIEGIVEVVGQLPFLGAVVTDGAFATAGAGAVSYGCGDCDVGIVAEAPIAPIAPIVPTYGYGVRPDALSYAGVAPYGKWGCGGVY